MSLGLGPWRPAGPACPRARPAPTARRCTKWQAFSRGEGVAARWTPVRAPCAPCTPHPAHLVGGHLCAGCTTGAGGRWWCWSSALAAPCAFPPWRGEAGAGRHCRGGVSCWRPAEAPSRRGARPLSTAARGAAGSSGGAQPDSETAGAGARPTAEGVCADVFASLCVQNPIWRSVLFECAVELAAAHRA